MGAIQMTDLNHPAFHDEDEARKVIEESRWPNGATCPHCGLSETVSHLGGKSMGPGWFHCRECREKFTVRTGTLYERSHIPLHKWLLATHLLTSSKKGMSAHQLMRNLGIGSYRTAWFMAHRIREGMRGGDLDTPMGGEGKTVEADETYFGNIPESKRSTTNTRGRPYSKNPQGPKHKRAIVSLVERGGNVRSFHPANADGETVSKIVSENIHRESRLHTDESRLYTKIGAQFAEHQTVKHSADEYVRGDVTTNTVEGYFSVFKRGMRGVYQHCSEKHLHRYLAEFDFRYNNRSALGVDDGERAAKALKGIEGKRLTYRISHSAKL
jgi:transposase-like protein